MAADIDEDEGVEEKRSSPLMTIIVLVVAALIAGGAGFGAGKALFAPMIAAGPTEAKPAMAKDGDDHGGADHAENAEADAGPIAMRGTDFAAWTIVDLDPITTNLAAPSEVWVRAELSMAVEGEPDPVLAEEIQADALAYLRTVRLQSVSVPSGFQHLVADLEDRARLRSDGQVKRVFVKALLLE